jgi:hypothetical protein
MVHPDIMRFIANERIDTLRAAARHASPTRKASGPLDLAGIELRLCKVCDDPQLEQLAQLAERPLPFGRFVVAAVDGRILAALPLGGGRALADPFVRTSHLIPLLELRAAQLRAPEPRRHLLPRYVNLMRGSTHA